MPAAVVRTLLALLLLAAVTWSAVTADPFVFVNFFGFFTIQSNLVGAAVLLAGAVRTARGTPLTTAWSAVRWIATTDLVIVGVVYWTLLAPLETPAGIASWTNLVLHGVGPAAMLLDWLLVRDRVRLPIRLLPLVLVYPIVWIAVVLVRGATDGWVPYPFLDPDQGYGVVWGWVAVIAGVFALVGALLRLVARRGPADPQIPRGSAAPARHAES
ncbi:Pr6Pr family membrane protein [Amnibacterium endophyticum]|uniref:Pr6Pr family membrane protein n=1 Tax=Amnibacterium endophyticum TaxID=2109337 RepID=A0ABW4LAS4_9MICO